MARLSAAREEVARQLGAGSESSAHRKIDGRSSVCDFASAYARCVIEAL